MPQGIFPVLGSCLSESGYSCENREDEVVSFPAGSRFIPEPHRICFSASGAYPVPDTLCCGLNCVPYLNS